MTDHATIGYVGYPVAEPTCCPDAYLCDGEIECVRHGGFDDCCDRTDLHVPQNRAAWHELMDRWEQNLLDQHIKRFKAVKRVFGIDHPYTESFLKTEI